MALSLTSNMIGATHADTANYNDETNFPLTLLLTNRQVGNLCKALASNVLVNIKLSKTYNQVDFIVGFLDH